MSSSVIVMTRNSQSNEIVGEISTIVRGMMTIRR